MEPKCSFDNSRIIMESPSTPGCAFAIAVALGAGFSLIGLIGTIGSLSGEDTSFMVTGIFVFMGLIGVIALWAGVSSPAKGFSECIVVDPGAGELRFEISNLKKAPYIVPLASVERFIAGKGMRNSGGDDGWVAVRRITALTRDGGRLWLADFDEDSEQCGRIIERIGSLTGIETVDETESVIFSPERKKYQPKQPGNAPAPFADCRKDGSVLTCRLRKAKRSIFEYGMLAVIFSIFTVAPAYIIAASVETGGGFVTVVASVFCFMFYAAFIFILMYTMRYYELTRSADGYTVVVRFPLLSFASQRRLIPLKDVQNAVVNRMPGGHCRFALKLVSGAPVPDALRFASRLSSYHNEGLKDLAGGTDIPLWEVSVYSRIGKEATVHDLEAVRRALE